jgi:hypothetical protein
MMGKKGWRRAEFIKLIFRQKTLQLQFNRRPIAIETDGNTNGGKLRALHVQNTLTGREELIPCNLLIYAVGFEHLLLNGVPRTEKGQLKMIDWCRVPDQRAAVRIFSDKKIK